MAAITPAFPLTWGRRVVLALGVPVCLALVAYTGFDLVANFGEGKYAVSYALPAGAKSLTLSDAGGQVAIKQMSVSQATLTGTARYSLIRSTVTEHTSGGRTTIGNHCPLTLVGDCELDATVSVPVGMPVSASTGGGNASVTGATGPVTLSSGGGDLSADHETRADVARRMRAILSRFDNQNAPDTSGETVDLDQATPAEMFDFLDRELGSN